MARSKLTDEVRDAICESIRGGNYANVSAQAAGITEQTFYNWLQRGEGATSGKYLEFFESVKKAEAEAEREAVRVVQGSFGKDWKAAMTYLERKYPQRWGRRERLEHTGAGGGSIEVRVVYDD